MGAATVDVNVEPLATTGLTVEIVVYEPGSITSMVPVLVPLCAATVDVTGTVPVAMAGLTVVMVV